MEHQKIRVLRTRNTLAQYCAGKLGYIQRELDSGYLNVICYGCGGVQVGPYVLLPSDVEIIPNPQPPTLNPATGGR